VPVDGWVIRVPWGRIGSVARAAAGNLAQRTLVDRVNRHPLTTRRADIAGDPVTIRQVQRLAECGLAPPLLAGDRITDQLAEHCAALLASRKRGRHSLPGVLLPLKLAVDGHTMLPEYVKRGVVRYLGALADITDSAAASSGDDNDPVQRVAELRTKSLKDNVPGIPGDRKRPPIIQALFNGFRDMGLNGFRDLEDSVYPGDSRDPKDSRYRNTDKAQAVMRSGIAVMSSGGSIDDPGLIAKAFHALTGLTVDPSTYQSKIESIAGIRDWVAERDWDDRVTEGMKLLITAGTLLGFHSPDEALIGCLYATGNILITSDRNSPGAITLPALRTLSTMLRAITPEESPPTSTP